MPAPSDLPEWALDASFASDGDAWAGDANKSSPGAGRIAEGFEPTSLPAEWLNWILNNHGSWAAWLEAERVRLSAYAGNFGPNLPAVTAWSRLLPASWGRPAVPASWTQDTDGSVTSAVNAAVFVFDLTPILHRGAQITAVRVLVDPGTPEATSANRMLVSLSRTTLGASFATIDVAVSTGLLYTNFPGSTGDPQWVTIDLTGSPLDVDGGEPAVSALWHLTVRHGLNVGTDRIRAISVDLQGTRISNE